MWIYRDLQRILDSNQSLPVQVLMGPRQCGKSSLLHEIGGRHFNTITLDDFQARRLAQADPALFLNQNKPPVLIDEVQYAPELFPQIKLTVDERRKKEKPTPLLFRLTGSNQILFDTKIKESLAGRASFFKLYTLSVNEIKRSFQEMEVSEIMFRGGWPELHTDPHLPVAAYLNDYIRTYVEKDIALSAGVTKIPAFNTVLGLLAARTGELLNFESLGREAGVSLSTVREWTGLIERAGLVGLLRPYHTNLNKRLIKTPKFYMIDTGLAVRLQGHLAENTMVRSPQAGHLFETLVMGEIVRTRDHNAHDWQLFFWRTKENEEYDFLVLAGNKVVVLDAQMAIQSAQPISISIGLQRAFGNHEIHLACVTYGGRQQLISRDCTQVPVVELGAYLQTLLGS